MGLNCWAGFSFLGEGKRQRRHTQGKWKLVCFVLGLRGEVNHLGLGNHWLVVLGNRLRYMRMTP